MPFRANFGIIDDSGAIDKRRALARVINGKRISSCEPSASDRAIGSRMWAYRC